MLSTTLTLCLLLGTLTSCDVIDKAKASKDKITKEDSSNKNNKKEENTTAVESSDGICSLELPSSWKSNLSLNSDASLINHSILQDKFVMVINEEKSQFPDGFDLQQYTDLIVENMVTTVTDSEKSELKDMKIGEYQAKQTELLGKVDDVELGYLLTFIESDNYYHQVIFWTFKDRLDNNKENFCNILDSFKTLK